MTSLPFLGRLSPSSKRSHLSSLHNTYGQRVEDYDMDELEPRPIDSVYHDDVPSRSRSKKPYSPTRSLPRSPTPDAWQDKASSTSSLSHFRPKPMFSGPPPPISASIALPKKPSSSPGQSRADTKNGLGSLLLFDYKDESQQSYQPDTTWRGLRRHEKSLEKEIQQLLDQQASGLVAGLGGEDFSDTGSSTPTGTFYSTATSKSRMINSLHIPTHSTPDGNVIPVRQPKSSKARGLRSARNGLRRSMAALAQLKLEEDAYVNEALAERRRAINHVERLSRRRENVSSELHTLEEDEEEPLGRELRDLNVKHDAVTQEIHELEEKLVAMRNQRRWLRDKMEDVKNRREAGLSGYRGALKDVNSEVQTLMHRPPFQPLDLEALQNDGKGKAVSTGGAEFLRLRPERRNMEMAKSWWSNEVEALEKRKSQITNEKQALDDGATMWEDVMQLVSEYESTLRQLMSQDQPGTADTKGKEQEQSPEVLIRNQLPEMDRIVASLESHMQVAEEKRWNLLICAIGAELEAFQEARDMLRSVVSEDEEGSREAQRNNQHHDESSDNEVPPDLLVSHYRDGHSNPPSVSSPGASPVLQRTISNNDVPPDLLAEHDE